MQQLESRVERVEVVEFNPDIPGLDIAVLKS
jgi:hypothetical protein